MRDLVVSGYEEIEESFRKRVIMGQAAIVILALTSEWSMFKWHARHINWNPMLQVITQTQFETPAIRDSTTADSQHQSMDLILNNPEFGTQGIEPFENLFEQIVSKTNM